MTRALELASLVRAAAARARCIHHGIAGCLMCRQAEEQRRATVAGLRALMAAVPGGGWR